MEKTLKTRLATSLLAATLSTLVLTGCATSRNYSPTMDNQPRQEYPQEKKEGYNLESCVNFFGKVVAPFWAVARFCF